MNKYLHAVASVGFLFTYKLDSTDFFGGKKSGSRVMPCGRIDRHEEALSSLFSGLLTRLRTPKTVLPMQEIRCYMLRMYVTISYSCWVILSRYFDLVYRD